LKLALKASLFGIGLAPHAIMRKKYFKIGVVSLLGLAGYFMALSAMLVASAEISGRSGSTAKRTHVHLPGKRAADLPSNDNSKKHGAGSQMTSADNNGQNPCLSLATACDLGGFDEGMDGPAAWTGQRFGASTATDGRNDSLGGHDFPYPASFGLNPFGAGTGSSGAIGGNGSSPPVGGDESSDLTFPDTASSTSTEPSIATSPSISQFFSSDPTPSGDPTTSSDGPPSAPGSGRSDIPLPVPEPSTFWLFGASLIALSRSLRLDRLVRRAKAWTSKGNIQSYDFRIRSFEAQHAELCEQPAGQLLAYDLVGFMHGISRSARSP
jgi:hypothetical protein